MGGGGSACCRLFFSLSSLQVALPVQGAGEGDVVQGSGGAVGAHVAGHAADAVLGLLQGQLPA